ncbi:hypothetical protein Xmau_03043 [Xenorhabdus mauleonii]|uniref:Uncharacterized protein n=1 Tax=Xenorhabdus mauleonii TaxID=351675 RepID=A0A1I3SG88_9GAMM|nr:hypothetical protein [Xenorhabdus mauleonii]PHM39138.1 hypothetical protein Xmau_03043 [Xenorhabdus mauleonii]SFJ56496.1 hypothetical protein SAMN05421680_11164 [Xenorhabdus mauleonii]
MTKLNNLETIAPGISKLSPKELEAMHEFTLLWTLFEANVLDTNASAGQIADKAQEIDPEIINSGWIDDHITYFSDRYFPEGKQSYHFDRLNLRRSDKGVLRPIQQKVPS